MIVGACIILSELRVRRNSRAVGTILQGAAQNIGMFIAARFIIVSW